ncbi:hypothetical protein [Thiomicrorhabdus sp. Kp2]|uniref:hypothetical protein n=1 Tax=Thiomicrorhabdus sp. Kp2 TaxID=1123518 RepID=UPI000421FDED|nr:hypothetical protein [Thiomicrorhabdus sp. Kp2]
MSQPSIDENKLKNLLSIDDSQHSKEQRTSMIIQGVNWLTFIQEILILFIYVMPLAIFSMAKTLSKTKDNK